MVVRYGFAWELEHWGCPVLLLIGIGGTASGAVGLVGGNCNDSLKCGVRCANFNRTAGNAIWYFGAAQSYRIGIDSALSALLVLVGLVGGNCRNGAYCGVRCANLNNTAGNARWNIGAAHYTLFIV